MPHIEKSSGARRLALGLVALITMATAPACGQLMAMIHGDAERPDELEFGLGPKPTVNGLYSVTLEPVEPLAKRKLQKVHVRVLDATGRPVEGAEMTVDGGMPEHGHGLPTRPRMTRNVARGVYEIDGLRFNMGGWWEFKLAISAAAGPDSVTFNLDL